MIKCGTSQDVGGDAVFQHLQVEMCAAGGW